jgi:hypothetical protein
LAQHTGLYFSGQGEKMIEAKGQIRHGGFERWIEKNFLITPRYAREWMNLARSTPDTENGIAIPFSSIRETVQHTRDNPELRQAGSPEVRHASNSHALLARLTSIGRLSDAVMVLCSPSLFLKVKQPADYQLRYRQAMRA